MTWQFFDIDGDGIKTFSEFFTVVSQLVFLGLAAFVVITEGLTSDNRFTDMELIVVVSASFGATVFVEFLKSKTKIKKDENEREEIH